mmetsp:Transcript_19470/g.39366  ORF Transcript_19470/g.39366 Transcript_19470/m.39366 type:complete len:680 (-) Transcript_19470:208-2247(-)
MDPKPDPKNVDPKQEPQDVKETKKGDLEDNKSGDLGDNKSQGETEPSVEDAVEAAKESAKKAAELAKKGAVEGAQLARKGAAEGASLAHKGAKSILKAAEEEGLIEDGDKVLDDVEKKGKALAKTGAKLVKQGVEKLKEMEEEHEVIKTASVVAQKGVDIAKEKVEQILEAEREHKVVERAANLANKGISKAKKLYKKGKKYIEEDKNGDVAAVVEGGKRVFNEFRDALKFDNAVKGAQTAGRETLAAAEDFAGAFSNVVDGEADIADLKEAQTKLFDKLSNIGKEGFKRMQQGSMLRNVLLERLDNIKKGVKETLSREIQEGTVDALKIAADNNISTRGLPWELAIPCALAPVLLKSLQFNHRLTLYFYVPQILIVAMLMIVNLRDECSYMIDLYATIRVCTDTVFVLCSYVLDMRLSAWYELNGGWEATPETAQRLLWRETVVSNFGISALSTGKATLLFHDMETESCLNLTTSYVIAPLVALVNIAAIILAFQWYCLSCDKTLLRYYILFLSCIYMITLAYHIGNLVLKGILCCTYLNCCFCCKRCLKRTARYMDSGLSTPYFHFTVKHFLLRESLASTISKTQESRRKEREQIQDRIRSLEGQIQRKKQALNKLEEDDKKELYASETIKNVINLTEKIFRGNHFDSERDEARKAFPPLLDEKGRANHDDDFPVGT